MPALRFEITNQTDYPVTINPQTEGVGGGLTVCTLSGDPAVAFLANGGYDDEVVYFSLALDQEIQRHVSPPDRMVITGMAFNPITRMIWCSNFVPQTPEVFAFDPMTGLEVSSQTLPPVPGEYNMGGMATNGLVYLRAFGPTLEMRTMGGALLGTREYAGRSIHGASASPYSWTFIDRASDEIVVIGPFGGVLATASAPGQPGSAAALAFDTITNHSAMPQILPEDGIPGPVGSPTHPDTPWDPEPWMGRHRLYMADGLDMKIYAGYLTEAP